MMDRRLWERFDVFAERSVYADTVAFFIAHRDSMLRITDQREVRRVIKPVVWQVDESPLGDVTEPALELPVPFAKALMTELWRVGVRPAGVRDDSDRVVAMQSHIDDLRAHIKALYDIISDKANTV
jgi:hypothetical protein